MAVCVGLPPQTAALAASGLSADVSEEQQQPAQGQRCKEVPREPRTW